MSITLANIEILRRALENYATVPTHLVKVDALAAAAEANLAAVVAEQEPTLDGLTLKNLAARTAELAAWTLHDERRKAATRIHQHALGLQSQAWFVETHTFFEALRPAFDAAAADFAAAYDELDGQLGTSYAVTTDRAAAHRRMSAAARVLDDLSRVRDTLTEVTGARPNLANARYDHPTRIATFPDIETLGRRFPAHAGGISRATVEWFGHVLSLGGAIRWNTPAEQETQVNGLPRYSTANTVGAEHA